jgi:hypothetical protein
MASSVLNSSSGLLKISEQNSLYLYIKLYLIKLLTDKSV